MGGCQGRTGDAVLAFSDIRELKIRENLLSISKSVYLFGK